MSEFLGYVLWRMGQSLVLILLAILFAAPVLFGAYYIHRRKYAGAKKFPWGKTLLWLGFAGYLLVVLYATTFRASYGSRVFNLHLFRAWREAWNVFSQHRWLNVLLNIAMFGPLGCFLPLLSGKFQKWHRTILAGFGASLAIEFLQLISARGVFDVDDLFCNTLGTAIGYFSGMTILSAVREKGKRARAVLGYGSLTLLTVGAVCSVFLVYQLKEYGNLPNAPTYRINTHGTQWLLDCDLPNAQLEVPVYRTTPRSIAACDAFGEEFRKLVGAEYTTISYYQEAAYYMDQSGDENGTHFLFVSYLDPGYEYSCGFGDDPVWCDASRESIEAALAELRVFPPAYAEFTVEGDGWHIFTVDQHKEGELLVDGTLRCRYSMDGTIRELENRLLTYDYYDEVPILSPEAAFQRLCAGQFFDEGRFDRIKPAVVTILSCNLGYAVDTKGFYQPVCYFDVVSRDGSYEYRIMIPAMK